LRSDAYIIQTLI